MIRIIILHVFALIFVFNTNAQVIPVSNNSEFPLESIYNNTFYGVLNVEKYPFVFEDSQVKVFNLISRNKFWVEIEDFNKFIEKRNGLKSFIQYEKVSPQEKTSSLLQYHISESPILVKVILLTENTTVISEVQSKLVDSKIDKNIVTGKATKQGIQELIILPFVQYISPVFIQPKTLLPNMYTMNRVNLVHEKTAFGHGYKGKGINIGVWDGGLIYEHVDNAARLINIDKMYYFADFSRHATHVSGIINGKGHRTLRNVGMAPESFVYGYDFYGDVVKEMRSAISKYAISITNNSFAFGDYSLDCDNSGIYLPEAAQLDQLVQDFPEMLHVVAVGNAAYSTTTNDFNCEGREWGYVEVGFQGAKNNITVGWLSNVEALWIGSSRGPTIDGRLKPELVTKGASVNSLNETNTYANRWGSSQASPAVAGIGALVQEAYKEKYGFIPKASTVKALLLNTARDMGLEGPDYRFGFGLVNADRAIESLFKGTLIEGSVGNQGVFTQNINIEPNTEKFQLTLTWSDLPAAPPYKDVLVNDLNLKLVSSGGVEYFPWILNPNQPQDAATKGIDNLNNFEQISINNPVAGNYTLQVVGSKVANAQQDFSIAYSTDPVFLKLTNPVGGERVVPGEQIFICWDSEGNHTSYNVQVSYNGGATWVNLASNLSSDRRYFAWTIPSATRSIQALVKVTSNLTTDVSSRVFTIMPRVGTVTRKICDGTMKLSWTPLTNATHYLVHLLQNDEYVTVGSTTQPNFTLSNLENGTMYWTSVTAVYDTVLAARSDGYNGIPRPVSCELTNDIAITQIITPHSGRKNTSSELSNSEELKVILKNYGSNIITNPQICYKLDNEDSVCQTLSLTINVGSEEEVSLGFLSSLNVQESHILRVWITTIDDEISNNSKEIIILNSPHLPLTLPYFQDFEIETGYNLAENKYILNQLEEYDYESTTSEGRLSVALLDRFAEEGYGAISLDNYLATIDNTNLLTLNLNLSNYQGANIYLDLSFLNHGKANGDNDKVWVRGADNLPWIEVLKWEEQSVGLGLYTSLKALNLTRLLKNNSQDFSSSFQVRFGQQGSEQTWDIFNYDGITLDNISVYEAGDDLEVLKTSFPDVACKGVELPVSIDIINHSYQNLTNVPIFYKFGAAVVEEVVANIPALDTITYIFGTLPNLNTTNAYELVVYIKNTTDLYAVNDTLKKTIALVDIVSVLPNLIGFEDNRRFIAIGKNNNWELGIPSNSFISESAEGSIAWVTGLSKNYLSEQTSYLYTPCYDFSIYQDSVQISFNTILDIEKNYDYLTLEYSDDGINWNKLGNNGSGFNWFNNQYSNPLWDVNINRWKVASNHINKNNLMNPSQLSFRFLFSSDIAETYEGAGIDDWYVTPLNFKINTDNYRKVSITTFANQWTNYTSSNKILASINSANSKSLTVEQRIKLSIYNVQNKYLALRRNWVVKSEDTIPSNKSISLYFTDNEYESLIALSSIKAQSQLAIIAYKGLNEDTTSNNNFWNRNYTYFSPSEVEIIPYNTGYFATINTDIEGEFYIVLDSNISHSNTTAITSIDFDNNNCVPSLKSVFKNLPVSGTLRLESSLDGNNFTQIKEYPFSDNNNTTNYEWNVLDDITATQEGKYYYRFSVVYSDLSISFLGVEGYVLECPCISYVDTIEVNICPSDSLLFGNNYYTIGSYTINLFSISGCDSTIHLNVGAFRTEEKTLQYKLCSEDSVFVGDNWYSEAIEDTLFLKNKLGCDSIINLSIVIKISDSVYVQFGKCPQDSIIVSGTWYNEPGNYVLQYINKKGCDSIVFLEILDFISDTIHLEYQKCKEDSILFEGDWLKKSGEYIYNLPPNVSCDSVVIVHVKNYISDTNYIKYNILCNIDSVFVDGIWYSDTGFYIIEKTSNNGCDSIVSLEIVKELVVNTVANLTYTIEGLEVQFTNLSKFYAASQWSFGDGFSSTDNSPIHTYIGYGNYNIKLRIEGNCNSDSIEIPLILNEDVEIKEGLFVYPNPTSNSLNVIVSLPTMQKANMRLVNTLGQTIMTQNQSGNKFSTIWDVSGVSVGRYFMAIEVLDTNSKVKRYHYPVVIVR